jgi:hypothetical protein
LSEADQLRYRIAIRTRPGDAIHNSYAKAVDALGEVSVALGTAAALHPSGTPPPHAELYKLDAEMTGGEEAFKQAGDDFLNAAWSRFG